MGFVVLLSSSTAPTTSLVVLGHYWRADALDLLVLLLDLLGIRLWIRVHPRLAILDRVHDLFLFFRVELLAQALVVTRAFGRATHRVEVAIEGILCINALLDLLVLVCELLGLLDL